MGLNSSNNQIAKELDLCQSDTQYMTTKLREGIVVKRPKVKLEGEIEFDEVYIVAGHKGQPDEVEKKGEFARDGDGFCEVHVNTIEGIWSLLRSWLRPHRGISQDKLPTYLAFFEFGYNSKFAGMGYLTCL